MSTLTATQEVKMTTSQTPLPLRSDTILGVCEAIGQDFGFNPLYLRLAFIAPLFLVPTATFAAYLGLGLVVAATRLSVKDRPAREQLVEASATLIDEEPLPIAA